MAKEPNYPRGKISADDEGEVRMEIGADKTNGVVVIRFAQPTPWIAFEKDFAFRLAEAIRKKAEELPDS
jgi:hypothetical protein